MKESLTIALASGGTGGHIFPAESLSEELSARGHKTLLITDKRYMNYTTGEDKPFEAHVIRTSGISGNPARMAAGLFDIGIGYFQAAGILKKYKPDVVVGFGGYPSFPTMYAAVRGKYKTVIHEQNSMLGQVNHVLAPKVDVIATSFPSVSGIREGDQPKVKVTGNPVRPMIQALYDMPYPELGEDGIMRILVTGGSQGASIFSTVVPQAIALLPKSMRSRIRVDQQCRPEDIEAAREAYDNLVGVSADLSTFFNDMPLRMAAAHLIICRSGASTLAEVAVAGRPAIMVPFPQAKDNHQHVNATALEDAGGGWVMPQEAFTAEALSARIEAFLTLPQSLKDAAKRTREAGRPDASERLADVIEALARGGNGRATGPTEQKTREGIKEQVAC